MKAYIKNFKKFAQFAFAFAIIAILCVVAAACSHTHEFTETVTEEATCSHVGTLTRQCSCGKSYTEVIPTTSHVIVTWYDSSSHWEGCANCSYALSKAQHSLTFQVIGDKHVARCDDCDFQSEETAHEFTQLVSVKTVTCQTEGEEVKKCVCGKTETFNTGLGSHNYTSYVTTAETHSQKCETCGSVTAETPHTFSSVVSKIESTCQNGGSETKRCVCGKTQTVELETADHDYSVYVTETNSEYHWLACKWCKAKKANSDEMHVEGSNVTYDDGDCLHYPSMSFKCELCDKKVTYEDDSSGYGAHNPVEIAAKEATDTQAGNARHWQCSICGRCFSGHGCNDEDELFAEDIVIPAATTHLSDYDDIFAIAVDLDTDEVSQRYYSITVFFAAADSSSVMLTDSEGNIVIGDLPGNADVTNLNEGDVLTLKFKIKNDGSDPVLTEVSVLSVVNSSENRSKFSIEIKSNNSEALYAMDDDGNYYGANYSEYNVLPDGSKIKFYCYEMYNGMVLKSFVINGKSYNMTDGQTDWITVTQDVEAVFTFDEYSLLIATIDGIDASVWNGPACIVDAYVTYKVVNCQANDSGRLTKNSRLELSVDNANITRVEIVFASDNKAEANGNAIKAGVDENRLESVTYSVSDQRTVINFAQAAEYSTFVYYADVSQARIETIKIYYNTYNTLMGY